MSRHTDRHAPASTFLVHFFGRGLVDEGRTYAVERFTCFAKRAQWRNTCLRRSPLDSRCTGRPGVG